MALTMLQVWNDMSGSGQLSVFLVNPSFMDALTDCVSLESLEVSATLSPCAARNGWAKFDVLPPQWCSRRCPFRALHTLERDCFLLNSCSLVDWRPLLFSSTIESVCAHCSFTVCERVPSGLLSIPVSFLI